MSLFDKLTTITLPQRQGLDFPDIEAVLDKQIEAGVGQDFEFRVPGHLELAVKEDRDVAVDADF